MTDTMTSWIKITYAANIPLREGRLVQIDDKEIAIFHLPDGFRAVDNRCPHEGGPLCDGITTGTEVVCPLHGWKVNLETGDVTRPAGCDHSVTTYPVRVVNGLVEMEVE